MNDEDKKHLIDTWIAIQKSGPNSELFDREFWAYEKLDNIARSDPVRALAILIEILQQDSSTKITDAVGAGIVEDILCWHDASIIEEIEKHAKINEAFRNALKVVDIWEEECSVHDRFYAIPNVDFPQDNEDG